MKRFQILFVFVSIVFLSSQSVRSSDLPPSKKFFCHTLLYQFSDSIEVSEKKQFLELFRQLPEKIEGLTEVVVADILTSSSEFDIIVTLKFTNKESLNFYQKHEDHDKINALGEKLIANYAYFRYWE